MEKKTRGTRVTSLTTAAEAKRFGLQGAETITESGDAGEVLDFINYVVKAAESWSRKMGAGEWKAFRKLAPSLAILVGLSPEALEILAGSWAQENRGEAPRRVAIFGD